MLAYIAIYETYEIALATYEIVLAYEIYEIVLATCETYIVLATNC